MKHDRFGTLKQERTMKHDDGYGTLKQEANFDLRLRHSEKS